MESSMANLYFVLVCIIICVMSKISVADDSITAVGSLKDGQNLISADGRFELGFFSPGNSNSRYVGIWYKNIPIQTVVWVANRNTPINDTSGVMMINNSSGTIDILSRNGTLNVWSSNSSSHTQSENLILQLLGSGNLVLRDANSNQDDFGSYLWQSFDYPTDTMLPGMKFGWDLRTGLNRRFTAWKSSDDPSPGDLYRQLELYAWPELTLWKGSTKATRSGPWNGVRFSGAPDMRPNPFYNFSFTFNKDEVYFTYQLKNKSVVSMNVVNETTTRTNRYMWNEGDKSWHLLFWFPRDHCDDYGTCGTYGLCNINESPVCQCLKGFQPKSPTNWNSGDSSGGCVRSKPLDCSKSEGFMKFSGVKLPETTHTWLNQSMNLDECKAKCLDNCSCIAYTQSDIRNGGSGCAIWFGDLIDMRRLETSDQDLYIRMPSSELAHGHEIGMLQILVVVPIALLLGILAMAYVFRRRRRSWKEKKEHAEYMKDKDMELPLFELSTIVKATNNFSEENKLGQGGFGSVYKGVLEDGQEIAVKRLSRNSGQGELEFTNEVVLIAKLQHRNLVKLLGCCLRGEEKMLVYEYMPNKSLDYFIFDEKRSKLLNWNDRFCIICGIARGLLYLHQDSRLRIIHRDMKASNVLLDEKMNAKISDFGMAKAFGEEQIEGETNRIAGTFGYMAPEYANDGQFSIKSDVFSFGILLLEIVSGKKNIGFYRPERLNLIELAWESWKDGKPINFVDEFLIESCNQSEVVRCVHIGLLCVQQHPLDRPSMSYIVQMLGNENEMPQPTPPAFLIDRKNPCDVTDSTSGKHGSSIYDFTDTGLEGR